MINKNMYQQHIGNDHIPARCANLTGWIGPEAPGRDFVLKSWDVDNGSMDVLSPLMPYDVLTCSKLY